jgi:hypothetical protein
VAIIYAKQAAVAARQTVREAHHLRVEEDFREFRRALWALHEAADNDRRMGYVQLSRDVLQAQTRLKGAMGMRSWVNLSEDAVERLYTTLDGHATCVMSTRHPRCCLSISTKLGRREQHQPWRGADVGHTVCSAPGSSRLDIAAARLTRRLARRVRAPAQEQRLRPRRETHPKMRLADPFGGIVPALELPD